MALWFQPRREYLFLTAEGIMEPEERKQPNTHVPVVKSQNTPNSVSHPHITMQLSVRHSLFLWKYSNYNLLVRRKDRYTHTHRPLLHSLCVTSVFASWPAVGWRLAALQRKEMCHHQSCCHSGCSSPHSSLSAAPAHTHTHTHTLMYAQTNTCFVLIK